MLPNEASKGRPTAIKMVRKEVFGNEEHVKIRGKQSLSKLIPTFAGSLFLPRFDR